MEAYKKWMIAVLAVLVLVALFYVQTKGREEEIGTVAPTVVSAEKQEIKQEQRPLVIDIKGAVRKPGVYEFPAGSRLHEAVAHAGGLLPEADGAKVNLAQPLQDGMMIYVPRTGEQPPVTSSPEQMQKVAVNTATSEELQQIPGVGPKRAEAIIQYREEHGPFQKPEDLLEIAGIGEKSLESMRDSVIVP